LERKVAENNWRFTVMGFYRPIFKNLWFRNLITIEIPSNNATFKISNLPKTVENIVDTKIINGNDHNDTYVNLFFQIDQRYFNAPKPT
jgi:hypothetical protein